MAQDRLVNQVRDHPRDFRGMIITAFVVVVIVNAIVIGWSIYVGASRPHVELSGVQVQGNTALCPGDTLDYKFVLSVPRSALVEVKTSVQRVVPGQRISFSSLQEFHFDEPTTFEMVRHWVVPPTYTDPPTGEEIPWHPGMYEHVTVANVPGDRDISRIAVPFVIRSDCHTKHGR